MPTETKIPEIKRPTDLVNLENPTEKDVEFHFNSEVFSITHGGFSQLTRDIAEHGIRKTSVMDANGHTAILTIKELPIGQRTKEGMSKAAEGLAKAEIEIAELKELNEKLLDENKDFRKEVDKLEKKLARA